MMKARNVLAEVIKRDEVAKAILGLVSALEQIDSPIKVHRIEFAVPTHHRPPGFVGEVFGGIQIHAVEDES